MPISLDCPKPDELRARIGSDEVLARRAKLRIFFGYGAGVGKSFATLEVARREKAERATLLSGRSSRMTVRKPKRRCKYSIEYTSRAG